MCLIDGWFIVFNAIFYNISLVEEIRVTSENHRPAASH